MRDGTSVTAAVFLRARRRGTRLLTLLSVVIATAAILVAGRAGPGSDNKIERRVLDASVAVAPDRCPNLVAAATGPPWSVPPTSEQVARCSVRADPTTNIDQ
jgi:hypothetical protein